ncbi:septum site-determining protein MinC [Rhodoferax sp. 4810]|nr:septum site-determining protein MinC [Rhodoferax jenense]
MKNLSLKYAERIGTDNDFQFPPSQYRSMNPTSPANKTSVFELKGSVITILVLHIKDTNADIFYSQLEDKMSQARSFFKSAPVLIDLSAVDEEQQAALDFKYLSHKLRSLGTVPVGVRGSAAGQKDRVLLAGLGLLPDLKTEKTYDSPADIETLEAASVAEEKQPEPVSTEEEKQPEPVAPEEEQQPEPSDTVTNQVCKAAPTKIIALPVRSGQRIFAPEGDLVILSSVNAGAEVLAAGNIHVYGALRGRALAGIHGDTTARIFSLQCNPELVAVAGEYVVNELLRERIVNQSVVISLVHGSLKFDVVGSFNPAP